MTPFKDTALRLGELMSVGPATAAHNAELIEAALVAADAAGHRCGFNEGVAQSAAAFPSNWLDPLLSGPDRVSETPFDGPAVERLLQAVQKRVQSLKLKATP